MKLDAKALTLVERVEESSRLGRAESARDAILNLALGSQKDTDFKVKQFLGSLLWFSLEPEDGVRLNSLAPISRFPSECG